MKITQQVGLYFVVVVILVSASMGIMLNRVYAVNVAHQRLTQEWKELQISINLIIEIDRLIMITGSLSDKELADKSYMVPMTTLLSILEQIRANSFTVEKFEETSHMVTEENEFLEINKEFDAFIKTINTLNPAQVKSVKWKLVEELNDLRVSARKLQAIYMRSMREASAYAERSRQQILYRMIVLCVVFLFLLGIAAIWFIYLINKNTKEMIDREKGMAIGLLAQSLAHEIRNPLGIIKSSTSVIQRKLPADSEEYEIAGYLTDEVNRIDQLIEQLLQFRKESKIQLKMHDPILLIEQVKRLLAGVSEKASIKIEVIDGAKGCMLKCDSNQIKQVLINVILNAIQASEPGSSVEISTSVSSKMYYIDIRDYGLGFKKDALKKAYDSFYTTKDNGLGLGLFVVKNIVESFKGKISIQPADPRGTKVSLGFVLNG